MDVFEIDLRLEEIEKKQAQISQALNVVSRFSEEDANLRREAEFLLKEEEELSHKRACLMPKFDYYLESARRATRVEHELRAYQKSREDW